MFVSYDSILRLYLIQCHYFVFFNFLPAILQASESVNTAKMLLFEIF